MSLQQAKKAVLEELYEGYLKNAGAIYDVTDTIKEHNIEPMEMGEHLVGYGLIKNQRYTPMGGLMAQISNVGILEIKPDYFTNLANQVVYALAVTSEVGIMEILQWEGEQFQRAFDLAKYMENSGLVRTRFTADNLGLELTTQGRDYYNKNKATFFK